MNEKFLVRILIAGPAILENMATHVGFAKMGVVYSHFQTLMDLSRQVWSKQDGEWINIRLTAEELRGINLA